MKRSRDHPSLSISPFCIPSLVRSLFMDPVSAVVIIGVLTVGLVALFAECTFLICRSCHRRPSQPSREVSRVFPSLSRTHTCECYTPISLETLKDYEDYSEDDCCPICIEEFKSHPSDLVRLLACKHIFHKDCIDEWIRRNTLCPLCKRDMFSLSPLPSHESIVQVNSVAEAS